MKHSYFKYFLKFRYQLYQSFSDVFPFAMIYAWLAICYNLLISENSFLAETSQWDFYLQGWWLFISQSLSNVLRFLTYFMSAFFVASFIKRDLEHSKADSYLPSLLGFLAVWLTVSKSAQGADGTPLSQPSWLLLIFISLAIILVVRLWRWQSQALAYSGLGIILISIYLISNFLKHFPSFKPEYLLQMSFSDWMGNGPSHLWQVLLWSLLAIFLLIFGFVIPNVLLHPYTELTVVGDNLSAALNQSIDKIPHLFTLYTVKDSFAMFGGVGLILALAIAVFIESRRRSYSPYRRLALWTMIPIIFDQNLPFLLGLPVILQPILLLPMVVTTLIAEGLGALCLQLGWLGPSVYTVPNGTPSLLFGFLASNGDWRYLLVTLVILVLSVLIYLPFVKIALSKEVAHEKTY